MPSSSTSPQKHTEPFVIAVSNRKGGTGKTTTVINLAAESARRGYRTLLIDLDSQGHASLGFSLQAQQNPMTIHDLLLAPSTPIEQIIQPTDVDNLSVCRANTLFEHAALQDSQVLKTVLEKASDRLPFDFILIDTPPSLDMLLISALHAAHGLLVPTTLHHLGAVGVRQLFRLYYRISATSDSRLKNFSILPTMMDRRLNLHRKIMEDLQHQYGAERLLRGIRVDIQLAEAFCKGRPVSTYAPRSRGAMDYTLCLDELFACWKL